MFKKLFTSHRSLWKSTGIGLGIFMFMMLLASSVSLGLFGDQHHAIHALNNWFKHHRLTIIVWHILLLAAIYYGWGWKVDEAVKTQAKMENVTKWDEKRIRKIKRFRWYLIGAFLLIDFMMFW